MLCYPSTHGAFQRRLQRGEVEYIRQINEEILFRKIINFPNAAMDDNDTASMASNAFSHISIKEPTAKSRRKKDYILVLVFYP